MRAVIKKYDLKAFWNEKKGKWDVTQKFNNSELPDDSDKWVDYDGEFITEDESFEKAVEAGFQQLSFYLNEEARKALESSNEQKN